MGCFCCPAVWKDEASRRKFLLQRHLLPPEEDELAPNEAGWEAWSAGPARPLLAASASREARETARASLPRPARLQVTVDLAEIMQLSLAADCLIGSTAADLQLHLQQMVPARKTEPPYALQASPDIVPASTGVQHEACSLLVQVQVTLAGIGLSFVGQAKELLYCRILGVQAKLGLLDGRQVAELAIAGVHVRAP